MSFLSFLKSLFNKRSSVLIIDANKPITEVIDYEDYYNNKYPKTSAVYTGRWLDNKRVGIDVRNFFNLYDEEISKIWQGINLQYKPKTDDEKALSCLKWVIDNIKYTPDKNIEDWQFGFETLIRRTGDCEDGAILLANLLLMADVPYWKIRLNAGLVKLLTGVTGHAYLTYFCEESKKWVLLDWSAYPNKQEIKLRRDYKEEELYLEPIWFSWNVRYCFSKSTREGEIIKI